MISLRPVEKKRLVMCVVVESDLPEYEDVWSMIEQRVKELPYV